MFVQRISVAGVVAIYQVARALYIVNGLPLIAIHGVVVKTLLVDIDTVQKCDIGVEYLKIRRNDLSKIIVQKGIAGFPQNFIQQLGVLTF